MTATAEPYIDAVALHSDALLVHDEVARCEAARCEAASVSVQGDLIVVRGPSGSYGCRVSPAYTKAVIRRSGGTGSIDAAEVRRLATSTARAANGARRRLLGRLAGQEGVKS